MNTSRRSFLKTTAAASALTAASVPVVHAAGDEEIKVALVGCGGRGTGATMDALDTHSKTAPIKLVAMADVFQDRLDRSFKTLQKNYADRMDVPKERQFLGFDAYKKAIACIGKNDIVIFATPPGFRWVMFTHAIAEGRNVFMEKPVTVDGPTSRRMMKLAKEASAKNMKVAVGLMVRHCHGRQELEKRIRGGEIGDIHMMRIYRMHPAAGSPFSTPLPAGTNEIEYQIRRFHSFLWASGGLFSDYYIHQIDETCWMKGAWPVKAHAVGGRHYRGKFIDQNFDHYSVEYTFADGTKLFANGRHMIRCYNHMASYVHGTKGSAIVSTRGHTPGKVRTFKSQDVENAEPTWAYPQPERNPYKLEWEDLVDAVRNDKPYNEVPRGIQASLVTSMGRMAAHTGQVITYDEILNGDHEFAPGLDKITFDSPAPLQQEGDGKYPVPMPGQKKRREY